MEAIERRQIPTPLIPLWIFEQGLRAAEIAVLCYLYCCARKKRTCYPSIATISKKTRLHKDTVAKAIKSLEARGLLVRQGRFKSSNVYALFAPPALEARISDKGYATWSAQIEPSKPEVMGADVAGTKGPMAPESEGQKRKESKDNEERRGGALVAFPSESEDAWRRRLKDSHPGIDFDKEIRDALLKKPGMDRAWFETRWLPRCSPKVSGAPAAAKATGKIRDQLIYGKNPEGALEWLRQKFPQSTIETWPDVPSFVRAQFADEVLRGR